MSVHNVVLLELARELYLDNSTCEGIANEFIDAMGNDIALHLFCEKYSDPLPGPFSVEEMEEFVNHFGQTLRSPRRHRTRTRARKGDSGKKDGHVKSK